MVVSDMYPNIYWLSQASHPSLSQRADDTLDLSLSTEWVKTSSQSSVDAIAGVSKSEIMTH